MINREEFNLAFYAAKGAYELDAGGGFLRHLDYDFVENGIWTLEETGLKAALYSDDQGNYILSFAGTEGAQDWYQNISSMGYGQWDRSRELITNRIESIIDLGSEISSFTITGHSLGGALAQYAAYDLVKGNVLKPDQIDLITFNGLGGVSGLRDKHGPTYNAELLAASDIYHYYEPSDLVVQLSEHLGGQESNYQITSSNKAEFFLEAHSLETIEKQMNSGAVLINSQANHHYFDLKDVLPIVQAFSSGTNGLLGGGDSEASEMEAVARLMTILPGFTFVETFPLKPAEYAELRDWILDNVAETLLGVSDPADRAVTVFGLGVAIGALSTTLNFTRLPLFIEATSQITASYPEYLYEHNDSPDATTPAKDALVFSLFSVLSGGVLNELGVLVGGKISRVEVNQILAQGASHEADRYSEIFSGVADILGMTLDDSLKGYIDFHHTLIDQGAQFSTVADVSRVSREQLQSWLNQSGYYEIDARLVRYSVLNHLPFILMGPESESLVSSEIKESNRYAKDTFSDHYWQDRLDSYELALSKNRNNLPYGEGFANEYRLYTDLETGSIVKNYLFADEVNAYVFGTEEGDSEGLEGGSFDDRLYGLGGDDVLYGRGGNDVLEGNDGNDQLSGGTGDDYLLGGADNDTYYFSEGHGKDKIEDVEGTNTIMFGDMQVTELKKVFGTEDTYKNVNEADDRLYKLTYYGFQIIAANGSDIVDVVAQSDFSRFGINVHHQEPEIIPESGDIVIGNGYNVDVPLINSGHWLPNRARIYEETKTGIIEQSIFFDAKVYDANFYEQGNFYFYGGSGDDYLVGGLEDDNLVGRYGNDKLVGAEGDDRLWGWSGNDNLSGGFGNDFLVGDFGSDTLSGGDGDDFLFGNGSLITLDAFTGDVIDGTDANVGDLDVIEGGAGNDWISSGQYVDILSGGNGDDQIFAAAGNDVIDGGEGSDLIMGDSAGNRVRYREQYDLLDIIDHGFIILDHVDSNDASLSYNDTIDGGAGDDTLIGEVGDDTISGGEGNDYIEGDKLNDSSRYNGPVGQYETFFLRDGTPVKIRADDFVNFEVEWSGNDTIDGGDGYDTIFGNAGNDTIKGGAGNDSLFGDDEVLHLDHHGNDTLHGGDGGDLIQGQGGNDTLYGDAGIDTLHGDEGDDALHGGDQTDYLYGGEGDDTLMGGADNDLLEGNEGNDYLDGGAGYDFLYGGQGNDTLTAGAGGAELQGQSGNDTYIVRPGDGTVFINDSQGVNTIRFAGGLALSDIDAYSTNESPSSNTFIRINYGAGENDVIVMSQASYSRILGVSFGADSTLESLIVHNPNGTEIGTDDNDQIEGNDGSTTFYGQGGDDGIDAGAGNDIVYGELGADTLYGNSGSDYLYGGQGNDVIRGGKGNDFLFGGTGNDTFTYSLGDGVDFISNYDTSVGRRDTLSFDESISSSESFVTQQGDDLTLVIGDDDRITVENFFKEGGDYALNAITFSDGSEWDFDEIQSRIQAATPFNDVLLADSEGGLIDGQSGDDLLTGQEGNDQLLGGEGDDRLEGQGGNDSLDGGDGRDELYGGAGDDVLSGGQGVDYLYGGQGNNTYHYALGDGNDEIRGDADNANDTLVFASNISPDDLEFSVDRSDLIITISASGETIQVSNFFSTQANLQTSLTINFDLDSSAWSDAEIREKTFSATEGNDTLLGTGNVDVLNGFAGDDEVYGFAGDDSLSGGEGHDLVDGGEGSDQLFGNLGNDDLVGGSGNDILDGGAGDDSLEGGLGNDTFLYGIGSGHDTIEFDNASSLTGSNTVSFTGALTANDLTFTRLQDMYNSYRDHLLITINETGETLTVGRYFSNSDTDTTSTGQVTAFEFSNGAQIFEADVYAALSNAITDGDDYIVAGDENDVIDGLAGNDWIVGGLGDDNLSGGQGNDILEGYAGSDTLKGGGGDDRLNGGSGNDQLIGGQGNDFIDAGDGDDTVFIQGAEGADEVRFHGGFNTLSVQGDVNPSDIEFRKLGRHALFISAGDELDWSVTIMRHYESDWGERPYELDQLLINGQAVAITDAIGETIHASNSYYNGLGVVATRSNGSDSWRYALGTEGDDLIFGDDDLSMYDELAGGAGDDKIYAQSTDDELYGDAGNDTLDGGAGDDKLYGGTGQDTLTGGAGDDRLMGGDGGDIYRIDSGSGSSRIIDSSEGFNTIEVAIGLSPQDATLSQSDDDLVISFNSGESVIVTSYFDSGTPTGVIDEIRFADNTVWDQNYIQANTGELVLEYTGEAPAGFNVVDVPNGQGQFLGSTANDFIEGSQSKDVIYGSNGRDIIVGQGGSDELVGGAEGDLIIGDGLLFGNAGDDVLESRNMSQDNYDGRAFMFGGDGNDTYRVGVNSANTFIYNGTEAAHYGSSIFGGLGGSAMDFDVLEFMEGISPDDINFYVNNMGLELEIGNNGYVVALVDYFDPLTYQGQGQGEVAPIDEIRFDDGTVWDQNYIAEAVAGLQGGNTGTPDDDEIDGTDQSDELYGGAGDDWIEGYGGDDVLHGEDGEDVLVGGSGNDILFGGEGDDDYDFEPGFGQDIIYNTGSDYNEIWLYEVDESDVAYAKQGNDLIVSIIGTTDQITVRDWYVAAEHKVVVYFDDLDTTHSIDHIESLALDDGGSSNNDPIASSDAAVVQEDNSVTIDVLSNDSDVDGDSLSVTSASSDNGNVTINGDGTLNYSPNSDFNGLDTISYEVSDGNGGTASATVSVTVNPENDLPVAIADSAITDDDVSVIIDVLSNDSDVDGDSLSIVSAVAGNGVVVINGDGTLSYTPSAQFIGQDSISYEVSDSNSGVVSSTVSVEVNSLQDDPVSLVGTNSAETLEGGNNHDVLTAKGGKDTLLGYEGDDTLSAGGGNDLVYGGEGNDTIKGGNGADQLYGNQGNDLLIGGKGNDTYHFEAGDDYDRINNASSNFASETDKLSFNSVSDVDDVWFKKTNNHLDIYVLGSDDRVRVNNWYRGDKYKLDSVEAGGQSIDTINIEQLVSAMAAFGVPSGGNISLTSEERTQVDSSIAAAWA